MRKNNFEDKLWDHIFSILAAILWIASIVLYIKGRSSYHTLDHQAQLRIANALRWQPACFIGAVICTAACITLEHRDGRNDRGDP